MKTTLRNTLLTLGGAALLLGGCGSAANNYMVRGTPEYQKVTEKLAGQWAVASYKVESGSRELLGGSFEKAQVDYDFATGRAKYSFWVGEGKLPEKLLDWQKEFPGIQVNEYKVVATAPWFVHKDGGTLELGEVDYALALTGSGDNFEGFYGWERTRFEAAKSAEAAGSQSSGGLGGLAAFAAGKLADKAVKSATGTSDLFVDVAAKNTFRFNDDGGVLLCGKGNAYKVGDTTSCSEAMRLVRTGP